jgi:hypothetical protein
VRKGVTKAEAEVATGVPAEEEHGEAELVGMTKKKSVT